ncbi:MAG: ABC transporter permease [Clostridia bacterium]|jgi:oligopeptide transport system permease protein|nr:ABC transporter permease [Clostridia bacterium]
MPKYIAKRLLFGLLTLFALATITFFMMHMIPGSPFAGEMRQISDVIRDRLIAQYDLDKPIYVQYLKYLKNILTGDFGTSLNRKGTKVVDIIAQGLPYTASLGFVAFCIAMVVGITLGAIAAFSKQPWINAGVAFLATIGVSVPSFLVALLMMLVFGVKLGWLPLIGLSSWKHYIMPATALAFAPIAMISRLVRSGLSEELRQDYITLAKSKGTDPLVVVLRHALKNAILPVITYAGPLLATLVTGSFVVETMFTIPGIGSEFVKSVTSRDYTFIMALTVLYGAFIIIAGIVTDLISAAIDPRVRLK